MKRNPKKEVIPQTQSGVPNDRTVDGVELLISYFPNHIFDNKKIVRLLSQHYPRLHALAIPSFRRSVVLGYANRT